MRMKYWVWFIAALACVLCLNACAGHRDIVIKSEMGRQSLFLVGGVEVQFPSQSNISFKHMHGASWRISGDITDIIREVVSDLDAIDFEELSSMSLSSIDVQEMVIEYQDERPGGADSYPIVILNMNFIGKFNNIIVDKCRRVTARPVHRPQVSHGLLASRSKMRTMIQPVYEGLIKEALSQAIVTGLNCLSRESKNASDI